MNRCFDWQKFKYFSENVKMQISHFFPLMSSNIINIQSSKPTESFPNLTAKHVDRLIK